MVGTATSAAGNVADAVGGNLKKTFIDGDLEAAATFSGVAFEAALGGAAARAAKLNKLNSKDKTVVEDDDGIEVKAQEVDSPNGKSISLSNNSARKLLQSRGATKQQAKEVVDSFEGQIKATQGKKGDTFTVTETSSESPASGLFVTKGSAGKTPEERIEKLALPESNKALIENEVSLSRDQILLEGEVKSQVGNPGFSDNATGGGHQVITDAFNGGVERE